MDCRATLSSNLQRLMDSRGLNPTSLSKLIKVPQSKLRDIKNNARDPSISTLDRIAEHFELAPWQLLVPGLDPSNPPVLMPLTPKEQAFYESLKKAFQGLK